MADVLCDENEDNLINIVVKQFDLLNYEVKHEDGSKKGDNYVGILKKLIITGVETDGKIFNRTFLFKSTPTDPKRREIFNCESCFNREIFMYETVLPKLTNFLTENNTNEKFKFAKLFAASKKSGHESLILEDLTAQGYEMRDRRKSLDIYHCKAVMKNFALLHSISFVLKRRKPELFNEISNLPEAFFNDTFLDYFQDTRMGSTLKRILACLDEQKERYLIDKVTEISKNLSKDFKFCLSKEEANNYVVICHGDSWINNMFFKYKDPVIKTIPNSVCLIDWQLSRCASPVLDLVYFFYSSTDKDLRDLYIKELYNYYYTNLSINLQLFGESIDELYPRYEYDLHIKKFSRLGIWVAMLLLQILLSKEDELFDSGEIVNMKEKYEEAMFQKAHNDDNYRNRVHDIIVELFEGQYI